MPSAATSSTPTSTSTAPCYFATEEIDAKGKIRKRYPHQLIMTPFDKLKSLPPLTFNLRPDITLEP
jgi:hypothetical protein